MVQPQYMFAPTLENLSNRKFITDDSLEIHDKFALEV